jgi:hypothetical protein
VLESLPHEVVFAPTFYEHNRRGTVAFREGFAADGAQAVTLDPLKRT